MADFTNEWQQFLAQQGISATDAAQTAVPGADFVAPLTHLGLIAINGEDAARFLHSQLTNDVESLGATEARLAGYCSPKGRLQATLLMWRQGDEVLLQVPRDIQAAFQERLQMFVLRAKAKLRDASEEYAVLGLSGDAAAQVLGTWFGEMPAAPYGKAQSDAGTLIRVADADGSPRFQWIAPPAAAIAAWPTLVKALAVTAPKAWRLAEIHAGLPMVVQATHEQFVPQMINFELIGGVNFKKGCYPGQEIVARSQYLGKLKRRMLPASIPGAAVHAGMEVFAGDEPEQPCGMVVNAENSGPDRFDCLVEIKMASLETGSVHLGAADGPPLQFLPLPYALPDPT